MSVLSRFFGNKETTAEKGLIANENLESSLSLQVIFSGGLDLNSVELQKQFRAYHKSLKKAQIEIDDEGMEHLLSINTDFRQILNTLQCLKSIMLSVHAKPIGYQNTKR